MSKTLLVGNFGDHNLGDELILAAALENHPDAVVMTSDPDFSQKFTETALKTVPFPPTGFRSFIKFLRDKKYRAEVAMLKHCDIKTIIFPGGGLFAIKTRACVLWWLVFMFFKKRFPKAEVRLEHQGVDQNLNFLGRYLAKRVFRQVDFVSVRDDSSGKALATLGIKGTELRADRVFEYLKNLAPPACSKSGKKLVIINAIKPFEIKKITDKYPEYRILFVPFARSDLAILPDDFPCEVIFPQTKTELFSLLGTAEVLIGERFHSLVCGYRFCGARQTFVLREPYSEKVQSFCDQQGIKRAA